MPRRRSASEMPLGSKAVVYVYSAMAMACALAGLVFKWYGVSYFGMPADSADGVATGFSMLALGNVACLFAIEALARALRHFEIL